MKHHRDGSAVETQLQGTASMNGTVASVREKDRIHEVERFVMRAKAIGTARRTRAVTIWRYEESWELHLSIATTASKRAAWTVTFNPAEARTIAAELVAAAARSERAEDAAKGAVE